MRWAVGGEAACLSGAVVSVGDGGVERRAVCRQGACLSGAAAAAVEVLR